MYQNFTQKWHRSAMEVETIKNGTSPKSQTSRNNLIICIFTALFAVVFFACNTKEEPENTLQKQLQEKRTEIHIFYNDSVANSYKNIFNYYISMNVNHPIFNDTIVYGQVAVTGWMEAAGQDPNNPTTNSARKVMKFDGMLKDYVVTESQANK